VTGLGRTKLYELIGAERIATTIGRRRLIVVRSLLALLDTNLPNQWTSDFREQPNFKRAFPQALIFVTRQRSLSRSNSSSHRDIIVFLSEFGGIGKSTASAERGTQIGPAYRAN